MRSTGIWLLVVISIAPLTLFGQLSEQNIDFGQLHGNLDINTQYYRKDSLIGAPDVPEQILFNGFMNLTYTRKNFRAGVRLEGYYNALLGFSPSYEGFGIPYRYAGYTLGKFDFTAGNFYEQFGSGFTLRAYYEPTLGIDNSIDGFRVSYYNRGVGVKALIGKQRFYFTHGPGIVRGGELTFQLNELVGGNFERSKWRVNFGGSVVSKYQADNSPELVLPENVLTWDARFKVSRKGAYIFADYAYKYNDPSADNGYIYRNGQAFEVGIGYSMKGFGINVTAHSIINMNYRSDRDNASQFQDLFINWVPSLTKPHSYLLMSTLYPYATQYQNEMALQVDLVYKFKKGSTLGGKYGTTIFANYSISGSMDTNNLNDMNTTRLGYDANLFKPGNELYWQDINVTIEHKFNKQWKLRVTYQNLFYNIDLLQGKPDYPNVFANVGIVDLQYKFNRKTALRGELQGLFTEQHLGNWAAGVLEFSYSPHWFVSVIDQYNYGNDDPDKRIHYFTVSVGYSDKANRVTLSYGRQREGLFCVGGICRVVPASNGVILTLSSTF